MAGRGRRPNFSRRGSSRRSNLRRVFKKMENKARPRPRAGATIRGGTEGATSVTVNRSLTFFPKKAVPAGLNTEPKWWIEGLEILGKIVMAILVHLLAGVSGTEPKKSVATGCIMRVALGAEDLLVESTQVTTDGGNAFMRYRQARVEWIRATVIPISKFGDRAGIVYLNIEPCTRDQFLDDFAARTTENITITELKQQPGIRYKSALSPIWTSWSPKKEDFGYGWVSVGNQTSPATTGLQGGLPIAYLTVAYSDNSANELVDVPGNYKLHEAMFNVEISAKVLLRQGEDSVKIRVNPISMLQSLETVLTQGNKGHLFPTEFRDGLYYERLPSPQDYEEEMVIVNP